MNTRTVLILSILVMLFGGSRLYAQSVPALFKDLNPGTITSNPEGLYNANGTLYFIAIVGPSRIHQLWKSDGTAANTVMVKDNIILTNIGNAVTIRGNVLNTLYYTVNKLGTSAGDTTYLWKTDGSEPVLVSVLPHPGYPGIGGGYPTQFTISGNLLFFTMWKDHGRELWVSDGTTAGTKEVIDLLPGTNGGASDVPMISFNNKVYFQGSTTLGNTELFSSDGTAAGTALVKDILPGNGGSAPNNWVLYKGTLYFNANNGLWKTDGTTNGTVNIAATGLNKTTLFKDQLYYSIGNKLWKSDGTTVGTTAVRDSVGTISGANNDYLILTYFKSLPAPPYFEYNFWRSDGTPGGTVRVSDSLGKSASFSVINNKMYNAWVTAAGSYTSGLWETDGTEAGTRNLLRIGYLGYPFVFNSTVFFSNSTPATGSELWSYGTGATPVRESDHNGIPSAFSLSQNYPNPFNPTTAISYQLAAGGMTTLVVYDAVGREVAVLVNEVKEAGTYSATFDGSKLSSGMYFAKLQSGETVRLIKMLMLK
jgi:ELWxxDGT repeat protein